MVKIDSTAHTAGFKFLYHYQKFNPDHLSTILLEQKIHCSDPSGMNDPWDFKPWFDYRPMLDNPESLGLMLENFRATAGPDVINDPARPLFEDQLRHDPKALQQFVEQFSRGLAQELCKRRIYCLTPLPDSILMWSHYTQNHTGICLEYSVDNPLFRNARPVKYSQTYPEWAPQDMYQYGGELVLTKAVDWAYEREFRLVGSHKLRGTPLHLDGNYLHLPPGALLAVIIGCEAPRPEITKLVHQCAPELPIKCAERVPNKYKLQII